MLIEDTFIQSKLKLPLPFKNLHKMGKEVKIIIPDDCVLVQIGEGKWEVRKIKNKLPKTWEEFCEMHPINDEERFISYRSIIAAPIIGAREKDVDKNNLPNEKLAKAMLALCQLLQLMKCYNGDWEPDWKNAYEDKYVITVCRGEVEPFCYETTNSVLVFKDEDLRDQFLNNFRDLIEIAKPLI